MDTTEGYRENEESYRVQLHKLNYFWIKEDEVTIISGKSKKIFEEKTETILATS